MAVVLRVGDAQRLVVDRIDDVGVGGALGGRHARVHIRRGDVLRLLDERCQTSQGIVHLAELTLSAGQIRQIGLALIERPLKLHGDSSIAGIVAGLGKFLAGGNLLLHLQQKLLRGVELRRRKLR